MEDARAAGDAVLHVWKSTLLHLTCTLPQNNKALHCLVKKINKNSNNYYFLRKNIPSHKHGNIEKVIKQSSDADLKSH